MNDDLDERLKKARDYFEGRKEHLNGLAVAEALIDARTRLSKLEAQGAETFPFSTTEAGQVDPASSPAPSSHAQPLGGVEDLATMLSEAKSDPPIEGLELFAVMRERDYLREMVLGLQAERDGRFPLGGVEVTDEMARAARAAFNESSGPSTQDDWRAALTAAFALIPKATPQGEPVAWRIKNVGPGWTYAETEAAASRFQAMYGWKIEPLYAPPPPPVAAPELQEIRDTLAHQSVLTNPPKHKYWGAGEPDCPRDIKAANGELHTFQCKICGLKNPYSEICLAPEGAVR